MCSVALFVCAVQLDGKQKPNGQTEQPHIVRAFARSNRCNLSHSKPSRPTQENYN